MQIPDTDTSEYAALIELAATGGRVRDSRVAAFAAVMSPSFWRRSAVHSPLSSQARNETQPPPYQS